MQKNTHRERDFGCMLFQDHPKLNFLRSDGRQSRKPEGEQRPDDAKSTQKCQLTALVTQSTVHIRILDASLKKQTKKGSGDDDLRITLFLFQGGTLLKMSAVQSFHPAKTAA